MYTANRGTAVITINYDGRCSFKFWVEARSCEKLHAPGDVCTYVYPPSSASEYLLVAQHMALCLP